ncbi:MAG: ABC transporter ATP-binding protein [Clostridiaceae bacterium]|jgi:ATP-binding cassette subfamily B protein|nr:ABC transporter ATP-binding protein [Clostridiaceae bacterium]
MARNKFDIDEELDVKFDFKQVRRLLGYLKPYKGKVAFTVLLMIASSLLALLGPYLVKVAIDEKIPSGDTGGLVLLAAIFVVTLVFGTVCMKYRIRTMSQIGQSVIYSIREDIFTHIQRLPFAYYDSRPHGKILVRVVNYVNSLSDLLSNGIINLITDIFTLAAIICWLLILNVRLALVCFAGLPVLITITLLIKNAQRKAWQKVSRKLSNMNAYIHESICGIKVTQSFAREKENMDIFLGQNDEYRKAWIDAIKVQFLMWPMVDVISVASACAIFFAGTRWLGTAGITTGIIIAFTSYVWRFWEPISNLGNFYNSIINAVAYLERIFETIDEKPTVANLPGAVEMPQVKGAVEFKDVVFCYEKDEVVLDHVSFKVEPGETIALVGPTGAGKSTIVSLVSRFYDVQEGSVLIDGKDVRSVTLESLRKQMGVMLQDTFIFSGTVMDNIKYSRLDATDEEAIAAAKAVCAHDFIMTLPDGYKTEVNERGSRLSVGQRQLISFARALLADPRILILDEATSSIDTKTELALQAGLQRLLKGRTSFIIAHRLSTIKNADRIMYIDNGRIIEQGSHEELMERKGAYYKLYTAQYQLLEAV